MLAITPVYTFLKTKTKDFFNNKKVSWILNSASTHLCCFAKFMSVPTKQSRDIWICIGIFCLLSKLLPILEKIAISVVSFFGIFPIGIEIAPVVGACCIAAAIIYHFKITDSISHVKKDPESQSIEPNNKNQDPINESHAKQPSELQVDTFTVKTPDVTTHIQRGIQPLSEEGERD